MALKEYTGAIVLEVDGREIEVIDLNVSSKTNRRLVKTMNSSGRASGYVNGIVEYELGITIAIPLVDDFDWELITNAKITEYPLQPGGRRVSYLDCSTTEISEKYTVDTEARRDIKLFSLRKIAE